jgi:biotin synthase
MIKRIIERALSGDMLNAEEIALLFETPLFTYESALISSAARQMCEKASNGLAEVHAQVGLDNARCPRNCRFCSFAACNKVFNGSVELTVTQVVNRVRDFESDGANAIYLMATSLYNFEKFIEVAKEVRKSLKPDTILVANIDDFSERQAIQLKDTGFTAVYHALRLGEGSDTTIPPEKRLRTFRNVKEAGLFLGTCVEPVGPEHTIDELVEKTITTREASPVYSGAARRIPIPDTELAKYGIVSEARMAHILAVVRLALGYAIPGNCTHEPNVVGASAGANLLWAETGSNPRDIEKETEGRRGMSVQQCKKIFQEAEWNVLSGPSKFFNPDKKLMSSEVKDGIAFKD